MDWWCCNDIIIITYFEKKPFSLKTLSSEIRYDESHYTNKVIKQDKL